MAKTIIFCSDHHIGGDDKLDTWDNTKEFIKFLRQIDQEHQNIDLVLLGDTFELLQITKTRKKNKIEKLLEKPEYQKLLNEIKRFSKKHNVIYIIGNHDQELYWNKDLQKTLSKYGMNITGKENLTYNHTFKGKRKNFTIYAEHGNQFDPSSKFIDYTSQTETPVSHHIVTDFANRIGSLKKEDGKGKEWLHDVSNVRPIEIVPLWFISNYFYEELNRIFKIISVPIVLGLIITRLIPIYYLFKLFNIKFFSLAILPKPILVGVLTIIGIDITIILLFVVFYIIKKDIFSTLRRYGITRYDEMMRKLNTHYTDVAKRILKGEDIIIQPQKQVDFFVHGHTHEIKHLKKLIIKGKEKGYAALGTWHKGIEKFRAMFGFPALFLPTYELTYLKVFKENNEVVTQRWEFEKEYKIKLTRLQKIAALGKRIKRHIKKPTKMINEEKFRI
jgi:UDP-2,3-diacylglucosamine pyrophosphatase LpxH